MLNLPIDIICVIVSNYCGGLRLKAITSGRLRQRKLRHLGDFTRFLPELLNPSLKGYFQALTEHDRFIAEMDAALEPWDVWICPVAVTPAFTHRPAWIAIDIDGRSYPHAVANGIYLLPFNLSGHPAVVIPIGQTQADLPIGIQIIGQRWREMELLSIAQKIDNVIGDFRHPPATQAVKTA
jgi:amidase